jgi:hypothetical protein
MVSTTYSKFLKALAFVDGKPEMTPLIKCVRMDGMEFNELFHDSYSVARRRAMQNTQNTIQQM